MPQEKNRKSWKKVKTSRILPSPPANANQPNAFFVRWKALFMLDPGKFFPTLTMGRPKLLDQCTPPA
jgi:hypothetical protein